MTGTEIHHPSSAEPAANTTSDLPGFEQFLARKALRPAHRTRNAMKERVVGKPAEIVRGQSCFGARIERRRWLGACGLRLGAWGLGLGPCAQSVQPFLYDRVRYSLASRRFGKDSDRESNSSVSPGNRAATLPINTDSVNGPA